MASLQQPATALELEDKRAAPAPTGEASVAAVAAAVSDGSIVAGSAPAPAALAPTPATTTAMPAAGAPDRKPGAGAARQGPRDYVIVEPALRQRGIDLVVKERWTISDAARAVGMKASTLYKSIERFKKGKVNDPSARSRGRPPVLSEDNATQLREWAQADQTLTNQALVEKARAEFGVTVSIATVRRATIGLHAAQLSEAQEACVREWLDDDCALTLKAIAARVQSELGVSVTVAAVRRAMRGLHFSLKRWSPLPPPATEWNSSEAVQARFEYGMEYIRLLSKRHKLVFVDEVQFSYSLRARSNATSAAAETEAVVAGQPIVRSQPFSVATALMANQLVMYKVRQGEFEELSFETMMAQVVEALKKAAVEDAVIVMGAEHKAQALAHPEIVAALGHALLFLPPQSPFLNPAEAFFSDWKLLIRRGPLPATERDLLRLIESVSLSPAECGTYFQRAETYIHPSILKAAIIEQ